MKKNNEVIIHKKCGKRIEDCTCSDAEVLTGKRMKRAIRKEKVKKAFKKVGSKIKTALKDPAKKEKAKKIAKKVLYIASGGRIKL